MDLRIASASLAYSNANALTRPGGAGAAAATAGTGASSGPSFAELMKTAATQSVEAGQQSEGMTLNSLNKNAQLTDIVAAVTNAEVTLETVVAVRDRVIGAYQDILKMPI